MNTLVSVVIASYNSGLYILETLESILNQSWKNIELIITDDCSSDKTVDLCRMWLSENDKRFVSSELITCEKNTGVSANVNRGLHAASGEWIKFLGADDTLKQNCIMDNILWISYHPEIKVLFSQVEIYKDTFDSVNLIETRPLKVVNNNGILASGRSSESQHKLLLVCDRIHFSPSVFLHRETLLSIGGFDERFRMLEDYPLWLNLTKNGNRLCFMDTVTVNYRQHSRAINNTGITYLINPNYFEQEEFRKLYTYPNLPADIRLFQRYNWFVLSIFRLKWLNVNNRPGRLLKTLLTSYFNPFKIYIYMKKLFNKDLKFNEFYM